MNSPVEKLAAQSKLLKLITSALDDKKAADLRVLRVSEQSSITDFLILATGTSEPHLRALRVELEKVIDATGTRILGMDTTLGSGWIVIDAFDIMIHVFTPENRAKYAMETLWKDAEELALADVLSEKPLSLKAFVKVKVKVLKKKSSTKAPVKKKTAAKKTATGKKPAATKKKAAPKKSALAKMKS